MLFGCQFEVQEVPGTVVVNIVTGPHCGGGDGLVEHSACWDFGSGGFNVRMVLRKFRNKIYVVIDRILKLCAPAFTGHHEGELHVVGGTGATHPSVDVPRGGGRDKVVILPGFEF